MKKIRDKLIELRKRDTFDYDWDEMKTLPTIWTIRGYNLRASSIWRAPLTNWQLTKGYRFVERPGSEFTVDDADSIYVYAPFDIWGANPEGRITFLRIEDYNRTWGFDPEVLVRNRARLLHADPDEEWHDYVSHPKQSWESAEEYRERIKDRDQDFLM